jgi:chemotaxis protein MotB
MQLQIILRYAAFFLIGALITFSSCKSSKDSTNKNSGKRGLLNASSKGSDDKLKARVSELEAMLAQKDAAAKALRDAINKALTGFANEGISVEQKNGRVTVSMEDRLMFPSGSTDVDKRGVEALTKIAQVLQDKKDLQILVEGHTDEVPVTTVLPSGARDNWDLSVLRATSVVRIMVKNSSLETTRITAAGRGPYSPAYTNKTPEARKKNRRTEIILTPNMDEVMKLLATE